MRSSPLQVGSGFYRNLALGNNSTLAIDPYGTLSAWGENLYGQLGTNSITSYSWTQLSNGDAHSLALRSDNTLWAWGLNTSGQLGTGDTVARQSPTQINANIGGVVTSNFVAISAGASHSIAIASDNVAYGWGLNSSGQVGDLTVGSRSAPVQIGVAGTPANFSANFSGSSTTYLSVANNTALQLSTGTFTIEFWVYFTVDRTMYFCSRATTSPLNDGWGIRRNFNSAAVIVYIGGNTYNSGLTLATSTVWRHVALTRDSNNDIRLFVDGISSGVIVNTSYNFNENAVTLIGQGIVSSTSYTVGNISNFRILKGTALYTTNFTPSVSQFSNIANTVLLTCHQPTLVDGSSNNFTIINNDGLVTTSTVNPFIYYSGIFNGTSTQYLVTSTLNSSQYLGTSDFTIEAWIYLNSTPSSNDSIACGGNDSASDWQISWSGSGFNFRSSTAAGVANTSSIATISINMWYHIAFVRSSGTLYSFLNGTRIATGVSETSNFTGTTGMLIASNRRLGAGSSNGFPGYISNLRVVKGVVVYTGNFTVPTNILRTIQSAGTNITALSGTETVLLTCQNSTFIDNSTNNFTITNTGSVTISSTVAPFQASAPAANTGTFIVSKVSAGKDYTLAIKPDSTLWSWGLNASYQLGSGATVPRSSPTQVGTSSWSQIDAGLGTHSLAIDTNNLLYGWGTQTFGQLGLGDTALRSQPTQIGASSWSQISAGYSHSLAVTSDNQLFTWGNNVNGQLGFNVSFISIAAGNSTSSIVRSDGTVWTWGLGSSGQLGDSTTVTKSSPVAVGLLKTWSSITRPSFTNYAIDTTNKLYAWGENSNGAIGDNTYTSRSSPVQIGNSSWTMVATTNGGIAGQQTTYAIRSDGALFSWGNNSYGQGNQISNAPIPSPVQIGSSSWSTVSAGLQFALAITSTGKLFGWGRNDAGQLGGVTPSTFSWTKVSSSGLHTLAIRSDNLLFAWGTNTSGQLGVSDTVNRSSPVQVASGSYTQISVGLSNSFAIRSDGSLWAWGDNSTGQIPLISQSRSSPVQIGSGSVYSVYFNATSSQWLSVPSGSGTPGDLGSSDFTIECWTYLISRVNIYPMIFDNAGISGNTNRLFFTAGHNLIGTTTYNVYLAGANSNFSTSIIYNAWTHLALVRSGTTIKLFVNGVQDATTFTSATNFFGINAAYIGGSAADGPNCTINGYISNFRIIRGQALFSGTFTPSTSPLTTSTVGSTGAGAAASITGTVTLLTCQNSDFIDNSPSVQPVYVSATPRVDMLTVPFTQTYTYNSWNSISSSIFNNTVLAIRNDYKLFGWGDNTSGQLGIVGSYKTIETTLQGAFLGLKTNGTLWAWGVNTTGVLGLNDTINRSSPVQVGSNSWSMVVTSNDGTAGTAAAFGITSDGRLFSWGSNSTTGKLGLGDTINRSAPVQISGSWATVASSSTHSGAIDSTGKLFTWGLNTLFSLGTGDASGVARSSPVQITVGSSYTSLWSSSSNLYAIRNDGTLWGWGSNANGQLGQNDILQNRSLPVQIAVGSSWNMVTGGGQFAVAIRSDGALFAWGTNQGGQLGDNTTVSRSSPIQLAGTNSWTFIKSLAFSAVAAIDTTGKVYVWGGNNAFGVLGLGDTIARSSPVQLGTATNNSFITIGSNNSGLITTDGSLFLWGASTNGGLGGALPTASTNNRSSPVQLPSSTYPYFYSPTQVGASSWSQVNTGGAFTLGIKSDSTLWSWGVNNIGQLGLSTASTDLSQSKFSPVQIGTSSWTSVSAGGSHAAAIRLDSGLFTWGLNSAGQLGNGPGAGDTVNRSSPVQVGTSSWTNVSAGGNHTMALRYLDGALFTWGLGNPGQLGSGTTAARSSPVQVGTSSWSVISAGASTGVAIDITNNLYAWGLGTSGQLGDNTIVSKSSPVKIGTLISTIEYSPLQIGSSSWSQVSAGASHAIGVKIDNTVFAWGLNTSGQLGDVSTVSRSSPVQVNTGIVTSWNFISAGATHSMAIDSSNKLYGWGLNSSGQLGDNTTTNRSAPTQIGLLNNWSQLSASVDHTLGLDNSGTLYVWGLGTTGQLGLNDALNRSSPVQVTSISIPNTSSPTQIGSSSYTSISAGNNTSTAISSDNKLFLWGFNTQGQLGIGFTTARSSPVQLSANSYNLISAGGTHTTFVPNVSPQLILASGLNSSGQLGDISTTSRSSPTQIGASITKFNSPVTISVGNYSSYYVSSPTQVGTSSWTTVSAGGTHTLGIKKDYTLWAWGYNANGQLGGSNTINRSSPVQIGSSSYSQVSAGDLHNTIAKSDGTINTFGLNTFGQLGDGT